MDEKKKVPEGTPKPTNAQRAKVLVEALPYIRKYSGKIVVVKYGGAAMVDENLEKSVMRDIVLLSLIGVKVVLVHGGGPEISSMLDRLGKKTEFVDGLRVTDAETAEVVQMVLAGKISKDLVSRIGLLGGRAVGLSGMDGGLIDAERLSEKLGYVGSVKRIDPTVIFDLLEKGYIPVISTIGRGSDGMSYNINADTAAARIAAALGAEIMIMMSDIPGILLDPNDPGSVITGIDEGKANELIRDGIVTGGMIPKTECCTDAIRRGVKRVFIVDGRVPHAILVEMLTDEGIGSMFV